MKLDRIFGVSVIVLLYLLFFRYFFSTAPFAANDFPLLFPESRDFSPFWAIAWDYMGNGGIGASAFKTMWIDLYANFVYFISDFLNIPWWLSQRLFWIVPFVLISIVSSYKFASLFIKDSLFRSLSCIIYSFNTYILLVVGGGQFGIAFAYSLSPLALFALFKLLEKSNIRNLIFSSLISGILIAFDPRIAVLTFGIGALWYIFFVRKFSPKILAFIFINFTIAGLLNSYWILPAIYSFLTQSVQTSISSFGSIPGVKFLSFATLENSMSLLHPNWPENIFGKIYFMRPEFLLIPILAFASLLFKPKKEILFLATLGLIGIFLGKGANEPLGYFYLFLIDHIPGFSAFRDPTKFYILIAISFAILIPYFLESVSSKLEKFKPLIIVLFVIYLLFTLRQGFQGDLTGIFKPKPIPQDYVKLKSLLENEQTFSRVLWVPRRQKYGFFNPNHPAVDSEVLFAKRDVGRISVEELASYSIKYVIIPYDTDSEIFLKDRKYDERSYLKTIQKVEGLGLNKINGFGKIAVYETLEPKERFTSTSEGMKISYNFVNPTHYYVSVTNAKEGDLLVFSEGFGRNWVIRGSDFEVKSEPYEKTLNSFILPKSGDYKLKVYYKPQEWVNIGLIISVLTLISLIFAALMLYFRNDRKSQSSKEKTSS